MPFTAHGRHLIVDRFFGTGSAPSGLWIAVCNVVPSDSDSAAVSVTPYEPVTTAGYGRQYYATSGGWYELSPGLVGNAVGISFSAPTADWGMLRGWAACTAETDGLVVAYGGLRQARRVTVGTPVQIRIDALQIGVR